MEGHWHGLWSDYGYHAIQDFSRQVRHFFFYPILAAIHAISIGKFVKTFKYPLARYLNLMFFLYFKKR